MYILSRLHPDLTTATTIAGNAAGSTAIRKKEDSNTEFSWYPDMGEENMEDYQFERQRKKTKKKTTKTLV